MTHFMFNGGVLGVPGNDAFTKILLHMDGSNGGTAFPDTNNGGISATWATNGPTTTTSQFKFGSASYQGTATGFIQSNQASAYTAGGSDFTVDFWMRGAPATAATLQYIAGLGNPATTNDIGWSLFYDPTTNIRASFQNSAGPTSQTATGATTVMDGNWHHIAFVKNAVVQIYIDGIATGTAVPTAGIMRTGSYTMRVGIISTAAVTQCFQGNIDEFRYSVGIARWTSNFVPPNGPYI